MTFLYLILHTIYNERIRAGWQTRVQRCVLCEIREICVRLTDYFQKDKDS